MIDNEDQEDVDDDLFAFSMRHRPNYLNHTFYNERQEVIGTLEARNEGNVQWTPGKGDITYSLSLQEMDEIIRVYCVEPERQSVKDDYFSEYVPVLARSAIQPENLSPVQREQLMQLNSRLSDLEEKLVRDVGIRLEMIRKADADNPDGLIRYYWCDIELDYIVGEDDPFFDDEDSGNSLIMRELSFFEIDLHYCSRVEKGTNWNIYEHSENHPMRDEVHCYLYHDLYDHAHLGWANMLRIKDILVNVVIRLDEDGGNTHDDK